MAALSLLAGGAASAQDGHAGLMQECIKNCTDCHKICLETLAYCQRQGGKHAAEAHLRILLDCAQVCQVSADFMTRGSTLHSRACGLCAEACEDCAKSCERFPGDAKMKACAAVCRRCAKTCRTMAGM
jgi:hypothetical protein